jgi:hypothetical protein
VRRGRRRQGLEADRAPGLRGAQDVEQRRQVEEEEEEAGRDDGTVPAKSNARLIKPPSDMNTSHAAT